MLVQDNLCTFATVSWQEDKSYLTSNTTSKVPTGTGPEGAEL